MGSHAAGSTSSSGVASDNESLRFKGARVVFDLAIAGGEKVEQFKNFLGPKMAETTALVLMAAAGDPVKTLGSVLLGATPINRYIDEKKESLLVQPLSPFVGSAVFGAETDRDQQAVHPASHATSSMLIDTLLSSLGVLGTKAGAIGVIKSSDGFSGLVKDAEEHVSLLDPKATTHILGGDGPTSGGHRFGVGKPGKSEFPSSWSDSKVEHAISDVATDPSVKWSVPDKRGYVPGAATRDGVDIKVVYDTKNGKIVTGYPTNTPKNPKP
ncbi:EndoU domain-containing protein [Xanthomonas bromi]|uniref:EndoU domain-containing protein n=1 Tax=Xanthomonas bromi TaxID=56449 RepID=UPI001C669F2D|nr:EndoU domain-containing protein [Xanthomonas bromi]